MRCVPLLALFLLLGSLPVHAADEKTTAIPENTSSIDKAQADALIRDGKQAMIDSNSDLRRSIDAAVAFSRALKYYEAAYDTDIVCELEANIFWCKKRMNIDEVKSFLAQKSSDKVLIAALAKANEVASKEVALDKAEEYFDRAEKFASANPDNYGEISTRYFEIAERFVGTPTGVKAQRLSMSAQQKQLAMSQPSQESLRATLFTNPTPTSDIAKKATVPSNETQKTAIATIRSLYKDDFAKRLLSQKIATLAKMQELFAASNDDPVMRYALLTVVVDLAMECRDYSTVIETCDLMAVNFTDVDAKAQKKTTFSKVTTAVPSAILRLLDDPQNEEANTIAGKYFCYEAKRWEIGIPLLTHGSNADLRAVSKMEALKPKNMAQQLELADRWFDIGKKCYGEAKEGSMMRALYWYKLSALQTVGIGKEHIAKRIEEIDGIFRSSNPHVAAQQLTANLAYNKGNVAFPKVSASFSDVFGGIPKRAVDGTISYKADPFNRWTTFGSPNRTSDWLEVEFADVTEIGRVDLYIYSDGGGVKLPKSYAVAVLRDGAWVAVDRQVNSPASPVGGAVNTAMFLPVATKKVRVVFTHQDNSRSGVTEIAIW